MLHPSSLIRLAVIGGVAFLVRAIVHEAARARHEAPRLPPPRRQAGEDGAARRLRPSRARAASH